MAVNKVLIVEDSPSELANLKALVAEAGYQALGASAGDEGIELAKKEAPDLILLDIVMPGKDGFATCRALKSEPTTKDIPIVFVTGKNEKVDRMWAQMQGGSGFVSKPYTSDDILAAIQKVNNGGV